MIVDGLTRLLAAQRLGLTEVPVPVAGGLTPRQVAPVRGQRVGEAALCSRFWPLT